MRVPLFLSTQPLVSRCNSAGSTWQPGSGLDSPSTGCWLELMSFTRDLDLRTISTSRVEILAAGMEACVGVHLRSRRREGPGPDARSMPAAEHGFPTR